MLFNSFEFVVFFPALLSIYFLFPHRFRWLLLLVASYFFYMRWKAEYILLVLFSTGISYVSGLEMEKSVTLARRRLFLVLGLFGNIGLLFVYKYFNFANGVLGSLFHSLNLPYPIPTWDLLLPVGISFYTFRTLSYSIDVYHGKAAAEHGLGRFALFVAFWPLLLAGPIERASHLLPQFRSKVSFDEGRVVAGLRLMLWGLFQKIVIADQLAFYVNAVYADPGKYSGKHLIAATLFFAFQIYCDFSGYSDIAIGASRTMGFDIVNNFERPYFSKSISDFWRRWHISLSTWFRDYVYIPLGGRSVVRWRWYLNLFITFLIAGLWHGASWTFVIWGSILAFYMVFGMVTREWRRKMLMVIGLPKIGILYDGIRTVTTFILVCIGWVFFRAQNIQDAIYILRNALTGLDFGIPVISGFGGIEFFCCACTIGMMEFIHFRAGGRSISDLLSDLNIVLRWGLYLFLIMTILLFSYTEQYQFIYFQF